jgi:hypothetical protein
MSTINQIVKKPFEWYSLFFRLSDDLIRYILEFINDVAIRQTIQYLTINTRVSLLRIRLKNYKSIHFLTNYIEKCWNNFRPTKMMKLLTPIRISMKIMICLILGEYLSKSDPTILIEKPKNILNIKNYIDNCLRSDNNRVVNNIRTIDDKSKNYNDYNEYNDYNYVKKHKMTKNEYNKSKSHTLKNPKKDLQKYRKHISKLEYRVMKKARLRKDAQRLPSFDNEWTKIESYDISYLDYDSNRYNYRYFINYDEYLHFYNYINYDYPIEVHEKKMNIKAYNNRLKYYQNKHSFGLQEEYFYKNCTLAELYKKHPQYINGKHIKFRAFINNDCNFNFIDYIFYYFT